MEYERLNRQGGFKRTVLQWLAKANKFQPHFQWKNKCLDTHTVNMRAYAYVK